MTEKKKQHIKLHIYDRDIPITIDADQEAIYRKAGVLLNEKLNAYFGAYKGRKDDEEIRYYAMMDIALRYVANKDNNDIAAYDKVLKKLTEEIEETI